MLLMLFQLHRCIQQCIVVASQMRCVIRASQLRLRVRTCLRNAVTMLALSSTA
jgi:hypothetical protein